MASSASWEVAYCKIKMCRIITKGIMAKGLLSNVSILTIMGIVGGTEDAVEAILTTGLSQSSPG
jgi:hypothetical protein